MKPADREPICLDAGHPRRGIVTSGGGDGEAHAACNVCGLDRCIEDALEWATSITGLPAEHRWDPHHRPQPPRPTLFDQETTP